MLSKTTRLHRRENGLALQQACQTDSYIETVRDKVEAIMEQLLAQKKIFEERCQEERQALAEELQGRDARIEKLETRVRQLQRENEQIRYQYGQRVALMGILKEQNSLLSRQYAQEKERMKETIDLLMTHNHALQQALSTAPKAVSPRRLPSPKPVILAKPQQFYSMTDLRKVKSIDKMQFTREQHKQKQPFPNESEEQPSLVRDLEESVGEFSEIQGKHGRDWEVQQSRITQVKGRGQMLGLDRMSAVTQLSRQRGGRH